MGRDKETKLHKIKKLNCTQNQVWSKRPAWVKICLKYVMGKVGDPLRSDAGRVTALKGKVQEGLLLGTVDIKNGNHGHNHYLD